MSTPEQHPASNSDARKRAAERACGSCGESPENECPKSQRPCGHHCNHVWTHDACDWCGKEFGDEQDAGDLSEGLTEAEKEALSTALYGSEHAGWLRGGPLLEAVERIVRERTRTAREQGRAEGEAEWVAAVEGIVYEFWSRGSRQLVETGTSVAGMIRAAFADRTKALDAVKAQAKAEALREAASDFLDYVPATTSVPAMQTWLRARAGLRIGLRALTARLRDGGDDRG